MQKGTKPRIARKSSGKKTDDEGKITTWIPRREACEILQVATSTLMSWRGARFRMKTTNHPGDGTIRWFCHRDDVERVRLERIGPRLWELERYVLESLLAGKRAAAIIQGHTHVTLADVERIRDQDARLSGACVLDRECVRELRQLLDIEAMAGPALVLQVRALVERVERLAAMRARRSTPPEANGSANGG